jgi:sortase A
MQAAIHQREYRTTFEAMQAAEQLPVDATDGPLLPRSLIGSLEGARVGLSTMVIEGDDPAVLRAGVGHLPDTPLPWQGGNSALAGHRDTFFRSLRTVRAGDSLSLRTLHGDFQYRVRDILIVDPADVWVLEPTDVPTLTLVTCYPFSYIGPAPKRFVVRAERL